MDELDRLLCDTPDHGPLHDAVMAQRRHQVDEAEVDHIAERVRARMVPSRTGRVRGLALAGLAAAAVLAVWASRSEPPLSPSWAIRPIPEAAEALRPSPDTRHPGAEAAGWLAAGRVDDAVLRYQLLLAEQPTDPRAGGWQRGLIEALRAQGDHTSALEASFQLIERYGSGTAWAQRYGNEAELAATSEVLATSAVAAHAAGRQRKDPALLDQAAVAYELYLHDLAEPDANPDMRYGYAELLYERERFDEAWEQYNTVVDHHPDPERAKFCAESAAFAAEQMVRANANDDVWRERAVASLDAYANTWPDDEKAIKMSYRAAYAVYERDPMAGGTRFETIAQESPDSIEGAYAAQLAFDAYVLDEDYEAAAAWAASWLALEGTDPQTRADIARSGAAAAYEATRLAIMNGADPQVEWAEYYEQWPDGPKP